MKYPYASCAIDQEPLYALVSTQALSSVLVVAIAERFITKRWQSRFNARVCSHCLQQGD